MRIAPSFVGIMRSDGGDPTFPFFNHVYEIICKRTLRPFEGPPLRDVIVGSQGFLKP